MDNLIFSLNATMPVFLVMVVGYFLKRIGMLDKEFVRQSNTFNFKVTLPVMLFCDIAATNIRENWDSRYVGFCAVATIIAITSVWFISKLVIKDKSMVGAFVQASYRSSAAVMGVAFIQNIYGTSGMAPLMIIGSVPLFNIFAVLILTFEAQDRESSISISAQLKKSLYGIITNPIIISIVLGIIFSYINIELPVIPSKALRLIANLASPLALIAIGVGFEGKKAVAKIKPTLAAASIKLLVLPAIFLFLAVGFGIRDQQLIALIVLFGGPATPTCYVMAQNMRGDTVLSSSVIVTTTLLSSLTLTFWIFVARSLGYIL